MRKRNHNKLQSSKTDKYHNYHIIQKNSNGLINCWTHLCNTFLHAVWMHSHCLSLHLIIILYHFFQEDQKNNCLSSSIFDQILFVIGSQKFFFQFYNTLLMIKFLRIVVKFGKTPVQFMSYIRCRIREFSIDHFLTLNILNTVAPISSSNSRIRTYWTYSYSDTTMGMDLHVSSASELAQ